MSAALVPDPLAFTVDALTARGALVEPGDGNAMALLPTAIAGALAVPEECVLHAEGAPGAVTCGLGSSLLERLVVDARQCAPVGSVRLDRERPTLAHAKALAGRFVVRNGLAEVQGALGGDGLYLWAAFAYLAEADDRHEGTVQCCLSAQDGAVPDASVLALIDPISPSGALLSAAPPDGRLAANWLASRLARRAERAIGKALLDTEASVARRHARDHVRICDYFSALVREARAPRRRVDPAAVETKVAHLIAERDAKLRDLGVRFALCVTITPAAFVWAMHPAVTVQLRLRRRKQERELTLRLPAGAQALDQVGCDACGGTVLEPALCDEQMHLLCNDCAPTAQGRLRCQACALRS